MAPRVRLPPMGLTTRRAPPRLLPPTTASTTRSPWQGKPCRDRDSDAHSNYSSTGRAVASDAGGRLAGCWLLRF
eukprot:m.103866 g.103866  ORF g.103866 m.103866 type:complete len:74 (+) comp15602_c0_seq1:2137-2358(+)